MSDPERPAIDPTRGPRAGRHRQFELAGGQTEHDDRLARGPRRPQVRLVTGAVMRRRPQAAVPVVSVAPRLTAVPAPLDAVTSPTAAWARHLNQVLALEIRVAVTNGILTEAEAEQLLARLVIVVDQAITPLQP
jgi:hypothetical protein